jgi:phospholipid/cholesterol/gamma-HCH transport system permease protein
LVSGSERGADMSTTQVLRSRFPRGVARAEKVAGAPARGLDSVGHVAWFVVTAMGSIGHALRYYRKETLRLIAEIGMGTGAMAVIGGTAAIVGFVSLSGSSLVAIQGFASLGNIGVEAFTGFFAAMINVRSAAPLVSGVALAAVVGAGATAELGAMRISEEIDALEVMGIKSISYLVSTRIMAGFVVIIPLYAMAMILSFLSGQVTTTLFYGQSTGTYQHYFSTFLRPEDVFWSFVDAIIISIIVMLNHCYYGYYASGGPVGVGEAVGRAMRASLVAVALVVLFVALALYGVDPNFNLTV